MKVGDTVRFLNTTGGGRITRIEGKIAYVDEDGFETPVLLKDIVVVMPAGHQADHKGANIMFDQKAFDAGKKTSEKVSESAGSKRAIEAPLPTEPIVETPGGDIMNIALVFEPADIRNLSKTRFSAVVVNDSNYFLDLTFLRRADGERGWTLVYRTTIAPNELIDVASFTHEELPEYERVAIQAIAYKNDKSFSLQAPVNISRRIDLTKFHKLHCFRPGKYFDTPVIEIDLVKGGLAEKEDEPDFQRLKDAVEGDIRLDKLSQKYNSGKKGSGKGLSEAANPHKLLPLQEIDLHIGELVDTTAGMEPKDMLELQLSTVRKTMEAHLKRKGQKIVFIHGKGEGVLRKAVLELLKKEYPKAELQDASFREYGFGATLVTIH